MKRCSSCGIISLKSIFHKSKTKNEGLTQHCKLCQKIHRKKYCNEHYDLENNRRKKYRVDNKKVNEYNKNKRESDLKLKLVCNLPSGTYKVFKSRNVRKTNKTFDLLGCSHSFVRRWNIHQLFGNMTIEKYGSVWQIDHCLPISSFNLVNENDVKKCSNWINLRSLYSTENNSKKTKTDPYLYKLQEIKANSFLKLNVVSFV